MPPTQYFLPPFVLRSIVRSGDADDKRRATHTLKQDRLIRTARAEAMATLAEAPAAENPNRRGRGRGLRRTIYIFRPRRHHKLPGSRIRSEGKPASGDAATDEVYQAMGDAYHFFREAFGRRSVDDFDLPLVATVHYSTGYNNAFWNGEQLVFGDGDSKLFNRFTGSLEIVGHELTHGIMQYTARMHYTMQAGAVHESICDVMGMLLKQWKLNLTADRSDWLIGTGLLAAGINGVALRSMKAPGMAFDDPLLGKDPQPGHMDDYHRTRYDNGGVHINSGIPNRAFYLAATALGGYAWERAGKIWYHTIVDKRLRPHFGIKRFARLTIDNAGTLFGAKGSEAQIIRAAWAQVGISVD